MKRIYNQPEVLVAHIRAMLLINTSDVEDGSGKLNTAETDSVW